LSLSAAVVCWAASAVADSSKLKGVYAFTGSADCIVSDTGFDPLLRPVIPDAFLHSFAVEGTRIFNGDGTGSTKGSAMSVTFGMGRTHGGASVFQFDFTYTVDDRTWTSDM